MSVTQDADLIINALGVCALFLLSGAMVIRWVQRGRIESYSAGALLPKWLPPWSVWLLATTFVIAPPTTDSSAERPTRWGITPFGWVFISCIVSWLLAKTI